jgi:carboxypeptidase Taq
VTPPFRRLRALMEQLDDLERVGNLLAWDQETKLPRAGAEARADQRATIERLAHELVSGDDFARVLAALEGESFEPDSLEAALVRVARREHERTRRVPAQLHADIARARAVGIAAWWEAHARGEYFLLLPHLERQLELKRRYVECFDGFEDPYDVLLDDYEEGLRTAEVEEILAALKRELVPLVAQAAAAVESVDDSFLHAQWDPGAQRGFSLDVLKRLGFEQSSWRLDDTQHPFAAAPSLRDIRLTTRFDPDNIHGIFTCLHEFGHGLYEHQVGAELARTPLAHGASAALHESQSRLWENLVGRSRPFWSHFYPRLQETFPNQLGRLDVETFYRGINKIQPSLIRVDADELTYNLHVILRFELERELLRGELSARGLPDAFDAKMEEYLGLRPHNVSCGVIQDMHWADGMFGYFPTYSLGNIIAVQLWERAMAEIPDLDERIERGEFMRLRDWLGERLHRFGRMLPPQNLVRRAVGTEADPGPYVAYLRRKAEEVYGVLSAPT